LMKDGVPSIITFKVNANGEVLNQDVISFGSWILYDHPLSGNGMAFPWEKLQPRLSFPWILAGGLNAENVGSAIQLLRPNGVDVSTGVCLEGGLRKDPERMRKFIQIVRQVSQ
jgi:phosphoribosylanthranilate isomerase